MTFLEKLRKLVNDRCIALTSKKSLLDSQKNAEEERDFNYEYLFGKNTFDGINDLISLYYQEAYSGVGRETTTPVLRNNTNSDWETRLELAATTAGDGSIYPDSNGDGVADKEVDTSSAWLVNNGDDSVDTSGLAGTCTNVKSTCGVSASQTGNNRGPFGSEELAEAHRDSTNGSGLLGKRTENSEIIDNDPDWYVGENGTDYPDYYDTTERTNLLTYLQTIITNLGNYNDLLDDLTEFITEINNEENQLFSDMNILSDSHFSTNIIGDLTDISSTKSSLTSYRSEVQTAYDYFNSFTASTDISGQSGYSQATFNAWLTTTLPALMDNIIGVLQGRSDDLLTKLGTISTGLKKYRYFWILEQIKKPTSPLIILDSIDTAISDAESNIEKANNILNLLINNVNQYITEPLLVSVSKNSLYNPLTGIEEIPRIGLIWVPSIFCPKYKIYRRTFLPTETPNNSNWSETYLYDWHVDQDEDTGYITSVFFDTSFTENIVYQYRVQAVDSESEGDTSPLDRADLFDSKSNQSWLYNPIDQYNVTSIVDGKIIVSTEHDFTAGQYIVLIDTGSNNGYYRIQYINTDGSIQLENIELNVSEGKIALAYGILLT